MHCLSKTSPSFRTIPGIIDGERSREATADVAERERRSFKMKPIPRIATHAQAEKTTRRPSKVVLKKIILVCYAQAEKATRRPSEVVLKKIILGTLKKLASLHRPNFIGKACNSGTIHGNYFFLLYQRVQIFFRAINHHKLFSIGSKTTHIITAEYPFSTTTPTPTNPLLQLFPQLLFVCLFLVLFVEPYPGILFLGISVHPDSLYSPGHNYSTDLPLS